MTRDQMIDAAIEAFNNDDARTHRGNPDSREHYCARRPILADDCDYEIVGFSGVRGVKLDKTTVTREMIETGGAEDDNNGQKIGQS